MGIFGFYLKNNIEFLAGAYLCLTQLSLPRYNPLQLFGPSNPFEYYDNNAELLFEFVTDKIALPLTIRLVWGIKPARSLDYFDTRRISALKADPNFRLSTVAQIQLLAGELKHFRGLPFVRHNSKFWPER